MACHGAVITGGKQELWYLIRFYTTPLVLYCLAAKMSCYHPTNRTEATYTSHVDSQCIIENTPGISNVVGQYGNACCRPVTSYPLSNQTGSAKQWYVVTGPPTFIHK